MAISGYDLATLRQVFSTAPSDSDILSYRVHSEVNDVAMSAHTDNCIIVIPEEESVCELLFGNLITQECSVPTFQILSLSAWKAYYLI